jgi:RES domain-containing protein
LNGAFILKQFDMIVYRVAQKKYAKDLSGEGARRNGGRWNHVLTPCLYTSESRALALLEFSVNTEVDRIPTQLVMLTLEVPEDNFMQVKRDLLPPDWNAYPHTISTQNLGTLILNESDLSVIGVPSSVVQQEWNFLLNPRTLPEGWPVIIEMADLRYDLRIKQ